MHNKIFLLISILLLPMPYDILMATKQVFSASIPNVFVNPPTVSAIVGMNFTVDVNISNVVDLYGWEIKLGWNNTLLDALKSIEGDFLKNGGETFFYSKINNTEGYVLIDCTLLGKVSGVNSSGMLTTIEFHIEKDGECTLDLYDTKLIDSSEHIINHTATDGYGYFTEAHDIAITNVTISKTVIGQEDTLYINVTAENQGGYPEDFNVTAYYDTTVIQTQTVNNLPPKSIQTNLFMLNTSTIDKGNYTISAYATPVPGEIDTSDNLFVDGWVYVLSSGHDVAITSIASRPIVGEGYTSPIKVTAMNVGNYTETFNVTLYINTAYNASEIVTLERGVSAIVSFIWNTTGFAKGNYNLSATASNVTGETDFTDNNYTDGWILVTKVGDFGGGLPPRFFECDGKCDGKDLSLFLQCFKETAPLEALYLGDLGGGLPPRFFKCDGKVDGKDLSLFLQCFRGLGP